MTMLFYLVGCFCVQFVSCLVFKFGALLLTLLGIMKLSYLLIGLKWNNLWMVGIKVLLLLVMEMLSWVCCLTLVVVLGSTLFLVGCSRFVVFCWLMYLSYLKIDSEWKDIRMISMKVSLVLLRTMQLFMSCLTWLVYFWSSLLLSWCLKFVLFSLLSLA